GIVLFLSLSALLLLPPPAAGAGNADKVALVLKVLSNPFSLKIEAGAKQYAREHKIPIEVFGLERETDVDRQIGIVDNLISRGYGAILISPADSKQLAPVCKKALQKNIVVISVDNPFHEETLKALDISIPFVGGDNRAGGKMLGKYIRHKLNDLGNVIVIEGVRGQEKSALRKAGFMEIIKDNTDIEILASESANFRMDESLSLAMRLFEKHDKVDAVFCADDEMALGALQALDLLNLSGKVLLTGYDNRERVREEMRNSRVHATMESHPGRMGRLAVELARKGMKGEALPSPAPGSIDMITHESFNKTIALSIADLSSPYYLSLFQGIKDAATLYGPTLVYADAKNNDAQQLTDISNFLSRSVDLLIIVPTNSETVSPGLELADQSGVRVITVDRKSSGGRILCHIESDNREGGQMAAKVIARRLKGIGRIIEFEGIPGTSSTEERGYGFNKALKPHPGLNVVTREIANFDRKQAYSRMTSLLKKNSECDAIFAHDDSMALGVIEALEDAGVEPFPVIIGYDGIREAMDAVQQGKLTATIAQKPAEMGHMAIQNAAIFFWGDRPLFLNYILAKLVEGPLPGGPADASDR
ncbi:MAG: substrate-binding domain-containing protein, partial [Desulfobacterales bacterium]|nr:substrate-binding domain-containing protein [Desulfobacterales bacterium]